MLPNTRVIIKGVAGTARNFELALLPCSSVRRVLPMSHRLRSSWGHRPSTDYLDPLGRIRYSILARIAEGTYTTTHPSTASD